MSQFTSHILDTSLGRPAAGVKINLYQLKDEQWLLIGFDTTDKDGRVNNLTDEGVVLDPGTYQLRFYTKDYFEKQAISVFYPEVLLTFVSKDTEHYHLPLLLNPFGYSTYRGS
jgi:5-hydroxyisourate hydrolase